MGFLGRQQPSDGAKNPEECEDGERPDGGRAEPVVIFATVHHHLETAEADRDERKADIVDAARLALLLGLLPRRVLDEDQVDDDGQDADRHVDEEDPAPREIVRDVAAERRSEHRSDDRRDRGQAERRAPFGRRERIEDDRLLVRLETAAEKALHETEDDELPEARCDPAEERADGEHAEANDEISFAADRVGDPARDGEHDAVGDEIGRQRPGRLVRGGGQGSSDMGQRDIDDRRVENFHEGRERHRHGNEPWVECGLPIFVVHGGACGRRLGFAGRPRCRRSCVRPLHGPCRWERGWPSTGSSDRDGWLDA